MIPPEYLSVSTRNRRVFQVPLRVTLVSISHSQHGGFIERLANDLQTYRQVFRGKAARNGSRGKTRKV